MEALGEPKFSGYALADGVLPNQGDGVPGPHKPASR